MRRIDKIIIHSSATPPSMDIGAEEIDKWHKDRGFRCIGYHFVIRRNGVLERGRDVGETGAHARGSNINSIGICWVGGVNYNGSKPEDNRTLKQKDSMIKLISAIVLLFDVKILGHRNVSNTKCPSFDAKKEYSGVG